MADSRAGLDFAHAELPPHEEETCTGPRQIGVAFSGHRNVHYRIGAGSTRAASYGGGAVIATAEEGITWSRVREPTEALEIYPDPSLVARLAGRSGRLDCWPVPEPMVGRRDPVVLGIAAALRRAHVTRRPVADVELSAMACRLVAHLLTEYGGLSRRAVIGTSPDHARLTGAALGTVADLVEADMADGLTLESMAASVHLSPFHFARAFKASTGTTPWQYVTTRRMDRARLLLRTTRLPVSVIATTVGMGNLSHFRRTFAEHTGCPPTSYRGLTG